MEYNWATLFLGDINTGTWFSWLVETQYGEIKYGHESRGTQTEKDSAGRTEKQLKTIGPTSRKRGRPTLKKKGKNLVPDGCLTPKTD
jgi:hypothetical protein